MIPASAAPGAAITLCGTNFTGASSVLFNGGMPGAQGGDCSGFAEGDSPRRSVSWYTIGSMDRVGWLADNWVNLLQGAGIVGSLLFTGAALHQGARSLRLSALLKLTEQHRELWSEVHRRPELARVLAPEVDLVRDPVTPAEDEFLNIVLVHFQTGWEMAVRHRMVSREAYGRDLMEFLALPIPRDVWNRTRPHRDPPFVRFVEECLARGGSQVGFLRSMASRLFTR